MLTFDLASLVEGLRTELAKLLLKMIKQLDLQKDNGWKSRAAMAEYLGCTTVYLDRLTSLGMPVSLIPSDTGTKDHKMYSVKRCNEWLIKYEI
jgi:hypothetical protein